MAQAEREAIASCPNLKCGKPVWSDQSDAWCHECGEYFPEDLVARLPRIAERLTRSTQSGGEGSGESLGNATPRVRAVMTRYRDAYRVSNAISRAGDSIKGAGVLLAVVFALFGLIAASQVGILGFFAGLVPATVLGLFCWLYGVLVNAQSQQILAALDATVSVSPFLTDDEKAKVMALP